MTQIIGIDPIPNQSFSARLDNQRYDFTIKAAPGVMVVSIARDDVQLIRNHIAAAGTPLLPYEYQEEGNFLILTENEELPDYTKFGITQFLVYLTAAEVGVLRAGT